MDHADDFERTLQRLVRDVYIEFAATSQIITVDQHSGLVIFAVDGVESNVVLSWTIDESDRSISWKAWRVPDGEVRDPDSITPRPEVRSGRYPKRQPSLDVMGLIAGILPKPKPLTVRPRGRLAANVFGATFALGAFAILRLFAVSTPPGQWQKDEGILPVLPQVGATMGQLASSLALSDLPKILFGSFVMQPALGLGIVAAVSLMFILHTLPQAAVGTDVLSLRTIAIYFTTVIAALAAVSLSPQAWQIPLGFVALYIAYAVAFTNVIPWRLSRWLRFARRVQLTNYTEVRTSVPISRLDGVKLTLGEMAEALTRRAGRAQRRIWKNRDSVFSSHKFHKNYFDARELRIILGHEMRALRRGRTPRLKSVRLRFRIDQRHFQIRELVLNVIVPFGILLATLGLTMSSIFWTAPSCVTDQQQEQTAYLLPTSPPSYLTHVDRKVVVLTSWDGYVIKPGECGS